MAFFIMAALVNHLGKARSKQPQSSLEHFKEQLYVELIKPVLHSKQAFFEHVLCAGYYAWYFHMYHLLESSKLTNALIRLKGDD